MSTRCPGVIFRRLVRGQISQLGFRFGHYPDAMADPQSHEQERVALRRSPKLSAFVLVSIVVGFFATLILTGLYPADPSVGFTTLFAYFALYGIAGTVGVGIVLWLLVDMRSRRRVREVTMQRDAAEPS